MTIATVQVWSAPACETAAVALGALVGWDSARVTESTTTPSQLVISGIPGPTARRSQVGHGRVLRVESPRRGVSWWAVLTVSDSDGGADTVNVTAGPLETLLGWRGFVRDQNTYTFDAIPSVDPFRVLEEYVLNTPDGDSARPELATDGLEWLSLPVDRSAYTGGAIDMPAVTQQTRLQVIRTVEQLSGAQFALSPLIPGGTTGFALTLTTVDTPTLGASYVSPFTAKLLDPAAVLTAGVNVGEMRRTRDAQRAPTVIVPVDANDAGAGMLVAQAFQHNDLTATDWVVVFLAGPTEGISGTLPFTVPGALVGAFLQMPNGTTREILESRVRRRVFENAPGLPDSVFLSPEVRLADVSGLDTVFGATVGLVATASGLPLDEFVSVAGIAARGRIVQALPVAVPSLARNYVRAADFTAASGFAVEDWTYIGGVLAGLYPRASSASDYTMQAVGSHAIGTFDIPVDNGPPPVGIDGEVIFASENVNINGQIRQLSENARFDAFGATVLRFTDAISVAIADNQEISTEFEQGSTTSGIRPVRAAPADIPRSGENAAVLRFASSSSATSVPPSPTQASIRSATFVLQHQTVRPERNTVNVEAGFTMTNTAAAFDNTYSSDNITSRLMPGVMLLDMTDDPVLSVLEWDNARGPLAAGTLAEPVTQSFTVSLSHTITADTALAVALTPPNASFDRIKFTTCNYVSCWVGEDTPAPVLNVGATSLAYDQALGLLADGAIGSRFALRGVDLSQLLEAGTVLSVGAVVRLRSERLDVDINATIFRIDWSLNDDSQFSAEAGGQAARISTVTVGL